MFFCVSVSFVRIICWDIILFRDDQEVPAVRRCIQRVWPVGDVGTEPYFPYGWGGFHEIIDSLGFGFLSLQSRAFLS